MNISIIISSISMMGIIILIGSLIGRKHVITAETKRLLMTIIINVSIPSIILNGIFNTEVSSKLITNIVSILLVSIGFSVLGVLLGLIASRLLRFDRIEAKKIAILSGLGNTGFIGIPLCLTIFGPEGGLLAAIYDAGVNMVTFTLGMFLLQQKEGFSLKSFKSLINMPIIAILLGVVIIVFNYHPPLIVVDLTAILASLAAPLAMIYTGLLIPGLIQKKIKVSKSFVSLPLIIKLILMPILMIFVLKILHIGNDMVQVAIIQSAMPTFMLAIVLFDRYLNDEQTAVITALLSTVLSLLTIPLIVFLSSILM